MTDADFLEAVVPDGVGAGDTINVPYEDTMLSVVVPEGVAPGDPFTFSVLEARNCGQVACT